MAIRLNPISLYAPCTSVRDLPIRDFGGRLGLGPPRPATERNRLPDHDQHRSLSYPRAVVVTALGTSQTLAWASSYYLPAILADPIGTAIGVPRSWVFAAFSVSLLIAAIAGPRVGRLIDRRGGRGVLVLSNLVLAAGLLALAS